MWQENLLAKIADGQPERLLSFNNDSEVAIQRVVPTPDGGLLLEIRDYGAYDECGFTFILHYDGSEFTRL